MTNKNTTTLNSRKSKGIRMGNNAGGMKNGVHVGIKEETPLCESECMV